MPTEGLQNKAALITGSTSGIGWGIAQALAAEGVHILLNGFADPEQVESMCRFLKEANDIAVFHSAADLTQPSQIHDMMKMAERELGGIDILVNNAGVQFVAPVEEFPDAKWDSILAVNLSAAFHTTKAVLPRMKQRKWGRIVNIASAHGLVASPFKSAYVSAKHGLVGLTKTVALETAEHHITCNAICPAYVRTPLVENQIIEQAQAHHLPPEAIVRDVLLAAQPVKEFVEVEHLGELVVFLCSPAGRMVTGAALPMDGGWTAR